MQPSLGQNQFQNPEEVYKAVIQVINKNKSSDLFHKAFLRPQQIALKTWRTQNDTSKPHDALPYGLKQVIKKDISLNKYVLTDFQSFDSLQAQNRNINFIVQKNYDNLISLIKPKGAEQKIKLCICICMYSQDKTMLRKTLAGVSNNIATFVHNGVSADDIVVAVVMDGIEKVHPTVVDFFGQMEKQSNIYLDDQVQVMEAKQMMKDTVNQIDQEEVINISNFIFDQIEFQDRKKRRFAQRKRQYQQVKGMRNKIQKLQLNKKIIYDDLDGFLKPFFIEKARQFRKRDAVDEGLQIDRMTQEQLIQYYSNNLKICRPVIFAALSQAKSYCQKYIQTRDNLALLNSFRFQVNFGSFDQIKKKSKSYQQINQQDRNRDRNTRMNLFLITKYKNSGKLSSHNWFFNGLCREIKTQYAILLDVGLCPEKTALFKMYEHMKQETRCGGVCGYMNLRIQRLQDEDEKHLSQVDCLSRLFSHCTDIQRAQQVQYHFAHLIDKPFQALFKFIHVLPGAFSAYRMKALQPSQEEDSKLMREYFKSLEQSTSRELKKTEYSAGKAVLKVLLPDFLYYCIYPTPKQMTQQQLLYDSNVYLAEDRTLCMGIHQNGYQLQYLPDAHAWVDPIKHLHGLLGQRKRWINGSFFAFQSVKKGLGEQNSGDCCLKLQIFYLTLMNMLAFVSPALFLFTVHIAMFAFRDWVYGTLLQQITYTEFYATQFYNSFVYLMDFIYVMLMLGLVFKSMHFTHRTERFIPYIYIMSTIMGMFSIAVFIVLFYDMILGIIDSILCLNPENQCTITFLAQVPVLRQKFFELLPGGVFTFMIYKWLVVGVVSLYIIPILVYGLFYCRIQFLMDVLFGTFSFLYYTPTYLNILNTFALCRIDDISWGTKGLDAEDNRNNNLKQSWKSIKILHVAKFVFWNVIVGAVMLIISSPINLKGLITPDQYNGLLVDSYIRKFFMTFFLMAIIGFALFLKIILGAMYTISYRCSHHKSQKRLYNEGSFNNQSRADKYFLQIKQSMNTQLKDYIYGIVDNVKKKKLTKGLSINNFNSIIVANKKYTDGASRKKAQEKWNNNVSNRSKVEKKNQKKPRPSIKPNIVNVQPQAIKPQLVTNSPNNPKAPLVAPTQPQQIPRNTLQQPQPQPRPQPQPQSQPQPQAQVQQIPRSTLPQPQPQVQPQVQQVSRSTLPQPQPQPQQIPRSTSPQPQPKQGQSNLNVPVANNIQNQKPRSPSPTPNSNPNVNPNQRSSPQISNSTSPNTSQMPTQSSNPNPKLINPSQQKPLNQNPYSNPIPNQYPIQYQNQIPNQYPVQYPNQQSNPNQRPSSSQMPNQPVRNPNQPVTTSNLRPPSQYPGQINNQYPPQNQSPQFTQKNADNSTQQLRVPDNRTTPRRTPGSSELKIVSDQMNSEAELKKSQLDNINGAVNPPKKIFGLF